MQAIKIKIACFGTEGHEYAKTFEGETSVIDALNFFLAQMNQSDFENVRQQIAFAGHNGIRVGVMMPGWSPKFEVKPGAYPREVLV